MKLLAPIAAAAAMIAAASAGQVYAGQSAESYVNAAELYQSQLEQQQHGLYSGQSHAPAYAGHDEVHNSRPAGEKTAKILDYKMENNGHQYQYAYETENGIKAQEAGETSEHGTVAHGAYSYTGDDGHTYTVTYTADEHGFHPQGAHLPTPPPIPEEIQKSLEQNARDEANGIYDDGKYKEHSGHDMSQGYQQYDAGYETVGYQAPSAHEQYASGAQLAYHAQSGHNPGAQLAYHTQSSHTPSIQSAYHTQSSHAPAAQLAYHAQSSHAPAAQLAYHAQSGHSGAELAYRAHSGHAHSGHALGSEIAYHGHH